MSVFPSSNWERSITRMKVVTLFALAVAALAIFGRYYGTRPTSVPREEALRTPVAKHDVVVPQPQQTAPEQSSSEPFNTGNGQSTALDDVLSATRQQVILAIQDPVQGTDVNRTLNKAKTGDSSAQYEMASRYANGEGVPQNFETAMSWLGKAASTGNVNAQWKLGLGYLKGIGVPHDEGQAAMWFKRAANNGDTRAQSALSDLYLSGRGVRTDYVRAYTWANIGAGLQGNNGDRLKAIRSRMTPAQIEDAQRRTSIWLEYASRRGAGKADLQRFNSRRRKTSE
jgi:TPR repeat protein